MRLLRPFEMTGPLIKTVTEILYDIRGYIQILGVLLFGYSVSFAVAMPTNPAFMDSTTGPLVGLLTSFKAIVGTFRMTDFWNAESTAFFLVYLFGMVVIMLNLLIAIMGDSYEKVKESERVEALRERAQIIVEAERTHPRRHKYHKYMHFVEVADSSEPAPQEWEGVTGRMKQLLGEVKAEVKAEIKAEVADIKAQGEKLEAGMREIKELLTIMGSKAK